MNKNITTLSDNYIKNIEILKENLKRGLDNKKAVAIINSMETQFLNAKLYNEMEKNFINEMRKTVIEFFTKIKINIIK